MNEDKNPQSLDPQQPLESNLRALAQNPEAAIETFGIEWAGWCAQSALAALAASGVAAPVAAMRDASTYASAFSAETPVVALDDVLRILTTPSQPVAADAPAEVAEWKCPTCGNGPRFDHRGCKPFGIDWAIQWIRNNYQDHANIASLCEALASYGYALLPPEKSTDQWESMRVADFNAGWNACRVAILAAPVEAQRVEPVVKYVPVNSKLRDGDGNHPNDDEKTSPECRAALDARGDDEGQGLDGYWKWGFRAGWNAALAGRPAPAAEAEPVGVYAGEHRDGADLVTLYRDIPKDTPLFTRPAAPLSEEITDTQRIDWLEKEAPGQVHFDHTRGGKGGGNYIEMRVAFPARFKSYAPPLRTVIDAALRPTPSNERG